MSETRQDAADPILVLDIGSSSVRALLYEQNADPVFGAQVSRAHALDHPESGAAIADARTLRGLVETCIDDVLTHPRATRIAAVACAAFADTLIGLDERGSPVTPVFTYADTRAASAIPALAEAFGLKRLHDETGAYPHPAHRLVKLAWLRATQPTLYEAVATWVDFPTYLYRSWFGAARSSFPLAAWSGMIADRQRRWHPEILDYLDLTPDRLPTLAHYSQAFVGLINAYGMRWGALRGTLFFMPVGDGVAANVGAGAVDSSTLALTVGTTAALRIIADGVPGERVLPGLFNYRIDEQHHLIGGATTEGGNIFAWAQDVLKMAVHIEDALLLRAPDAHGLTVLPLLGGERSPGYHPDAAGAVIGMRFDTTPLDLAQAFMESVALRVAAIGALLPPLPNAIVAAGGGVIRASRAWTQMFADALDRPLHLIDSDEVTARGTAILALAALRALPIQATRALFPPTVHSVVTPKPDAVAAFAAARARQAELYRRLYGGE